MRSIENNLHNCYNCLNFRFECYIFNITFLIISYIVYNDKSVTYVDCVSNKCIWRRVQRIIYGICWVKNNKFYKLFGARSLVEVFSLHCFYWLILFTVVHIIKHYLLFPFALNLGMYKYRNRIICMQTKYIQLVQNEWFPPIFGQSITFFN